jgi:hypothetical protein
LVPAGQYIYVSQHIAQTTNQNWKAKPTRSTKKTGRDGKLTTDPLEGKQTKGRVQRKPPCKRLQSIREQRTGPGHAQQGRPHVVMP